MGGGGGCGPGDYHRPVSIRLKIPWEFLTQRAWNVFAWSLKEVYIMVFAGQIKLVEKRANPNARFKRIVQRSRNNRLPCIVNETYCGLPLAFSVKLAEE